MNVIPAVFVPLMTFMLPGELDKKKLYKTSILAIYTQVPLETNYTDVAELF